MPKWSIPTIHHVRPSVLLIYFTLFLTIVYFLNLRAGYAVYNYDSVPKDEIKAIFLKEISKKLVVDPSRPICQYDHILDSEETLYGQDLHIDSDKFLPTDIINGSYMPKHCTPQFSVAILVTYRGRQSQLNTFLPYIHNFLRKQNIHYKVFLIEQQDDKPWNKGLLYNVGARLAAREFPCLILHDVDLLPLDEANLYACTKQPRHLSASIDKFRFVLTYSELVGGVMAISSEQYTQVNGFSNGFTGWGGEDDNFAERIAKHGLKVIRFPRTMSRYMMLRHRQAEVNSARYQELDQDRGDGLTDGLKSVRYQALKVTPHRLFTLVGVKV